ncbi:MAG: hypothetical protein M3Y49_06360 [Actinomycetota bacterium]|nr:hypothetical protein [Actinomycetota bacterium]
MLTRTRNSIAAVAITVATAGGGLITAAPAQAATSYDGYCKDATGTTVVVDFRSLGGGVVIRCATAPLGGSGTGLNALQRAGIPITGTQRYGNAFICRLYNKPSASQSLAIAGNSSYKERCLNTPPTAAHWAYWSANNGGSWVSSSLGVASHTAIRGGFEGWSFTLNSGDAAPRVNPTRPRPAAAPQPPAASNPPATSKTTPKPQPKPTTSGTGTTPSSSATGGSTSATRPGTSPAPGTKSSTSTAGGAKPSAKKPSASQSSSASTNSKSAAGSSSASGTRTGAGGVPVANSDQLAALAKEQQASGSAINLPTVLGVGLLAVLALAGGGVLVYRRFR